MKPETEQLLGTLEVIAHNSYINTFVWETEKQGELNLWNLMLSRNFVDKTDIDLVIQHWQNIEIWGTPTDQKTNGYEYAPYREEREDNDWNDEIAKQRKIYYQELSQLCQQKLHNFWAYTIQTSTSGWAWRHPNFYVSIIVGQTNNNWICLAPVVEDLCLYKPSSSSYKSRESIEDSTIEEINSVLSKLTPITLYDYYHGGYNMTHQHRIVKGVGSSKEKAIASALQESRMVTWKNTSANIIGGSNNDDKLNQFMNQALQDRTYCRIGFWDVSYCFEFGKTSVEDWIGIQFKDEFQYNP